MDSPVELRKSQQRLRVLVWPSASADFSFLSEEDDVNGDDSSPGGDEDDSSDPLLPPPPLPWAPLARAPLRSSSPQAADNPPQSRRLQCTAAITDSPVSSADDTQRLMSSMRWLSVKTRPPRPLRSEMILRLSSSSTWSPPSPLTEAEGAAQTSDLSPPGTSTRDSPDSSCGELHCATLLVSLWESLSQR